MAFQNQSVPRCGGRYGPAGSDARSLLKTLPFIYVQYLKVSQSSDWPNEVHLTIKKM